jgi:hypothetical protein
MSREMPDEGAVLTEHFKSLQGKLVNSSPNNLESLNRLKEILRETSDHEQPDFSRKKQDLRNWRASVDPARLEARIKSWADSQVYPSDSAGQKRCENRIQSLQALKAAIDDFDNRFDRNKEESLRPAQELLDQQDRLRQEQNELEEELTELEALLLDTEDPKQKEIIQAQIDGIRQRIHKIRPEDRHRSLGRASMPEASGPAGHQPTPNHSPAHRGPLSSGGAQASENSQRLARAQPSGEPLKLDEIEKELIADEELLERIESFLNPKNGANGQNGPKVDDMKEFHRIADRNAKRIEALRQLLESNGPNKLLKSPSNEIVDTKKLALRNVARCEKLSEKVASIKPAQVHMLDLHAKYGSRGPTQARSMGTPSLRSRN